MYRVFEHIFFKSNYYFCAIKLWIIFQRTFFLEINDKNLQKINISSLNICNSEVVDDLFF